MQKVTFDLGLKDAEELEEDDKGLRSWRKHLSMWRNMRPTKESRPQCMGLGVAGGEAGQVNRNQIAKAFRDMLRNLDLTLEAVGQPLGFYFVKEVIGSSVFFSNSCQHLGKADWNEDSKMSEEALVTVQERAEDLTWGWDHFLIHSADLGG